MFVFLEKSVGAYNVNTYNATEFKPSFSDESIQGVADSHQKTLSKLNGSPGDLHIENSYR